MAEGVVVVYLSRLGGRLSSHQEIMLDADAKVIAELLGYEYSGHHCATQHYADHVFFVPDDTCFKTRRCRSALRVRPISMAASSLIRS